MIKSHNTFNQDYVFENSEGDKWFDRNAEALNSFDADNDLPFRLIRMYDLDPESVFEIGAANGARLAALKKEMSISKAVAIEPSEKAILDGMNRYAGIQFIRSVAMKIPLEITFDLGIVNFVLHWIDRRSLLHSIAEIDRLINDKGFLIIGDFFPSYPSKVRYHYTKQKVYTFKQNYVNIFVASGLYHIVGTLTTKHSSPGLEFDASSQSRIGTWLLQKREVDHYASVELETE
jgi:SAM-dependent methyltransferase